MSLDTITFEDALKLLRLPRVVGADPEGHKITAHNGRYGPYLRKGKESRSLETEEQIFTVTVEQAEALFAQPKQRGGGRSRRSPSWASIPTPGRPCACSTAATAPTSPTARSTRRSRAAPTRSR